MKNILLATTLGLAMVTGAHASPFANGDRVQVKLGYANNNVVDTEALLAEVGVITPSNVRAGLTTQTNVQDEDLIAYGAYAGIGIPAAYGATFVPAVGIEHYDNEKVTTGFVQAGLEYPLAPSVDVSAAARYTDAFKSDNSAKDIDGVTYLFGVTKTF